METFDELWIKYNKITNLIRNLHGEKVQYLMKVSALHKEIQEKEGQARILSNKIIDLVSPRQEDVLDDLDIYYE